MEKNKILKICSSIILIFFLTACGISGKDPKAILKSAGLKINDYEIVSQSDNLQRDASAWDSFEYVLRVKDDKEELTKQLDNLVSNNEHWSKENATYTFFDEDDDSFYLSITVLPNESLISIDYSKYNIFS